MSTLKALRDKYLEKNTQFILIDANGIVIDSDQVLFKSKKGELLSNIHPFFISIDYSLVKDILTFTCVHLDIDDKALICDITAKKEDQVLLLIISDFSEHYNSFQSLAQSRNETAIASELLAIDNYILNKKEQFKTNFISNFNHELVSPILSILTFSDILTKTSLSVEQKEYLDVITASSTTLKNMVNDIFDISKIETGILDVDKKRFSLKRLIKLIKTDYKERCKAKRLSLIIDYADDMPAYIVSDKLRIRQIITNLLDNAIKYTKEGTISITIKSLYRRARNITFSITVVDTGIGIDPQYHKFIFERFNRLESSKHIPGSGLGLAVTEELVSLLNGKIDLNSELNKGANFTVTIRATTPMNSPNPNKNISESKENNDVKKEILLVEDNYADQLSIFKILANTKDYFIDIATNGNEALNLCKKKDYDLIVMDYKMTSMDGLETSKAINQKNKKNIPILLITALKIEDSLINHYKPFINDILYKPFDAETLLKRIKMYIK